MCCGMCCGVCCGFAVACVVACVVACAVVCVGACDMACEVVCAAACDKACAGACEGACAAACEVASKATRVVSWRVRGDKRPFFCATVTWAHALTLRLALQLEDLPTQPILLRGERPGDRARCPYDGQE